MTKVRRRVKRVREVQGMLAWGGRSRVDEEPRVLPHRVILATWPDDWRERWGRRANDLEEQGLSWRVAEGRAFVETCGRYQASEDVLRN